MIIFAKTLTTSLALAGLTALCLNPSADAQATDSPASTARIEIAFERHELLDPVRLARLEAQIEAAATRVCREDLLGDLLRPVTLRACIRDATNRAMEALESHQRAALTVASNQSDNQR